jgi:peptide/nickel transport system permease protein
MAVATQHVEAVELLQTEIESPWRIVFRRFRRHRLAIASLIVLLIIIGMAVAAPLVTTYDPNRIVLNEKDAPPSLSHIMGTDYNGRDLYTRIVYAGRISLGIAFSVVALESIIGIALGVISGFFGGWIDAVLMRTVDFILTLPFIPILLVLITIFSPSIPLLIIVLSLTGWVGSARLVRGQILSLREQPFIEASRALAASHTRNSPPHAVRSSPRPKPSNATPITCPSRLCSAITAATCAW